MYVHTRTHNASTIQTGIFSFIFFFFFLKFKLCYMMNTYDNVCMYTNDHTRHIPTKHIHTHTHIQTYTHVIISYICVAQLHCTHTKKKKKILFHCFVCLFFCFVLFFFVDLYFLFCLLQLFTQKFLK